MQTFQSNSTGPAKTEGRFGSGVRGRTRKAAKGIGEAFRHYICCGKVLSASASVSCLRNVYDCALLARNPLGPARVNINRAAVALLRMVSFMQQQESGVNALLDMCRI